MKVRMLKETGTSFFVSVARNELFAYKLSKEEAFNFSAHLFDWENGNKLAAGEFYDGFVAVISVSGKFIVGKMQGCLVLLDPKVTEIHQWPEGQLALENNCLFELQTPSGEASELFHEMPIIVRDLPIAETLRHSNAWIKPEGDPDEVDRQIKDKIISAALNDEEIDLSVEEQRFFDDNFWLEYITLFKSE